MMAVSLLAVILCLPCNCTSSLCVFVKCVLVRDVDLSLSQKQHGTSCGTLLEDDLESRGEPNPVLSSSCSHTSVVTARILLVCLFSSGSKQLLLMISVLGTT